MNSIILPIELKKSRLLGFKVDAKKMHNISFSIGCVIDDLPQMPIVEIAKNINNSPSFKLVMENIGIDTTIKKYDTYNNVTKTFENEIIAFKGVIVLEEVNTIHLFDKETKSKLYIDHDEVEYMKSLSILSDDIYTIEYVNDIKKKLLNINIVDKRPIRRPTIDLFSNDTYTKDNINDKLDDMYKFFSIKGSLSTSTESNKVYLHSEGLYKITYKTLSEYNNDIGMEIDILLGGWVYHSDSMNSIYKVYGTEVVSIPTKFSKEYNGYVIYYEHGKKKEMISNDEFRSLGFYRDFNIAQHISSENNIDGILSKRVSQLTEENKELKSQANKLSNESLELNDKLTKCLMERDRTKHKATKETLDRDIKNLELKKKYTLEEDGDWLYSASDVALNVKNIALSAVAVIGAGFAIHSYFSE